MKKALAIVTLSTLLSACAGLAPTNSTGDTKDTPTEKMASSAPKSDDDTSDANVKKADEHLPLVELTSEILFKELSSEIAFQRGNWQSAYVTLMSVAKQTRDPRPARRAAEMALSAKQAGDALVAIRLWRELAPDSEEATQYFLGFIILSNNLAEAQPILEQRVANATPQTRGLIIFQIQRLLSRAQDKVAAMRMLETIVAPYLSMPEAHLALAQSAFSNGDSPRAIEEANLGLQLKPDSELAILTVAQVAPDKVIAGKALTDFLASHPKAREVRIAYARTLVEQKEYDKARAQFEILLKTDKEDLTTLLALGLLNAQIGDTKTAEKYLTQYVDKLETHPDENRDNTQALQILAQMAAERNDIDGALKWLAKVGPGEAYLDTQLRRAQLIAKRGDIDGARKVLAQIETNGEGEEVQVTQVDAQFLRDANRNIEALHVLEVALKHYPKNTDLLYDYAMVAEKLDKVAVMETSLRKLIEIAPNSQQAYNALGYSLAERNIRLPEALVLIKKALSLAPQDPFILDSMGWVEFRMGNLTEAEVHLRAAYGKLPDVEIGVHLGEVLWTTGKKEEAQKIWRELRAKDPKNAALTSTLTRLHVRL
ncbi:tetratricopeptide repeat protein [Glaciimonas sp. CA11.2]|uniref:tetratricopeptide repeat protein n=1 Tax=Glaciimonas sp. CA11.2 TaxID=3048601 RepID=UPI002AB59005|nr:tetratricopeptide repeat protein [Glaciimonas sp. CA11.2]MDY7545545.1 tetratricopeptide repeat protein [Glaciimonas sp. CA11.2]MEB0163095.1 tetratricopeptide repeat protein [Glaciimonas sp. CA11.2]